MCKLHYTTSTVCGHDRNYKITYCKKHKDGLKGIGLGCMDREKVWDNTTMSRCLDCVHKRCTGKEAETRATLWFDKLETAHEDDT